MGNFKLFKTKQEKEKEKAEKSKKFQAKLFTRLNKIKSFKNKDEAAKKKIVNFIEKIVENVRVFFSAYLIAFVIRLLLIEAYQIPSQSMVPSLRVRDILMVEKFSFGTVMPFTRWKVPCVFKPRRNDIIVFMSPEWKSPGFGKELISLLTLSLVNLDNTFETPKNLVKRLVAEPGDTISMSNQMLIINGKQVGTEFVRTVQQVQYSQLQREAYRPYFDLYQELFTGKQRIIQHLTRAKDIKIDIAGFDRPDFIEKFYIYRGMLVIAFPEIKVPQKGVAIDISKANNYYKYLLKLLIERETGKSVYFHTDSKLYQNGIEITNYTPKNDYYFAMGDNRDQSEDCRYFGFIPKQNIFGRILFRYFPFKRFAFRIDETDKSVMKRRFN